MRIITLLKIFILNYDLNKNFYCYLYIVLYFIYTLYCFLYIAFIHCIVIYTLYCYLYINI